MGETSSAFPDNAVPETLEAGELFADVHLFTDAYTSSAARPKQELTLMFDRWLEIHGADPAATPHLSMSKREFDVMRNAPPDYTRYIRNIYGIPADDQENCRFVTVDVEADDPALPHVYTLMDVTDNDYGTTIEHVSVERDLNSLGIDPSDPTNDNPDYAITDIAEAVHDSTNELPDFVRRLMSGITSDPFTDYGGDIGIRAGTPVTGQRDAFVWKTAAFRKSIELTIAFPTEYKSVCIIRGQRRDPINGKVTMEQIDNPAVVLEIGGENLNALQAIYRKLYREPDYAVSKQQQDQREALLGENLKRLISGQVEQNRVNEENLRRARQQQPHNREMPLY